MVPLAGAAFAAVPALVDVAGAEGAAAVPAAAAAAPLPVAVPAVVAAEASADILGGLVVACSEESPHSSLPID